MKGADSHHLLHFTVCGMVWDRNINAARIFLYLRFNLGKRPFAFQRPRSSDSTDNSS